MKHHETVAIAKAIEFIGIAQNNSAYENALDAAALKLQFVMDCDESDDARQIAAALVYAFGLMPRIQALRDEAAA